jgi:hypothetical protein
MAIVEQLPATVDVSVVVGDELSFPLTFSTNLNGYAIESGVYNAGQTTVTDLFSPTLTVTHTATETTVLVTFTEAHTEQLPANGNWRWYLRWISPGSVTRTVVSGQVNTSNP